MPETNYLEQLPPEADAYEFEERAAIIEYYDNKTRAEAESIALEQLKNQYSINQKEK